jgi:hypothetical protein
MFDPDELRRQRDRIVARALTQHTIYLAMALRDWIQEEAREARPVLQSLEPMLAGVVAGRLKGALQFLDDLERGDAKAAFDEVGEWCDEITQDIEERRYLDPLQARLDADRALWRLERQIRELFSIRLFADRFADQSESIGDTGADGDAEA